MNLVLKKCLKCGAEIEVLKDCKCGDCGIVCCGEKMAEIKANTVDCAVEKHLPQIEIAKNDVIVTVNHVMDDDHYIEWIAFDTDDVLCKKFFAPGDEAKTVFPYKKGAKIYSYCNKHGLWSVALK